jgi:glycosyltransferase involved in cell wall biosynthesis
MKNIVFIHQSAELYGSDKTLLLLLKYLDKTKYTTFVILPNDGLLKTELEKENIKVFIAPVLKLYRKMFSPKNFSKFLFQKKEAFSILNKLHKLHKFDIVYSNTLAVLAGMLFAKRNNIKHIWHVHEIIVHPKIIAFILPKLMMYFADLVICNSNATKDNITKRVQFLELKTIVIYNGVEETDSLSQSINKQKLNFNSDDIVVTLVGRISRLKGHKWLLDTYISKLSDIKTLKIVFVGSPVENQEFYLEEIETIISQNNLTDVVKILPFTKDLQKIWEFTDIAIMPSTEAESFGMVAVEAMFAQKPVIGSNHGGLKEIIDNEKTGFLIEPNNQTQLADAILKLIKNSELRLQFGKSGFEKAKNQFSIQNYIQKFEETFSRF